MVYAEILAGGNGTRIGIKTNLPKQFALINQKPVIIYTIEKFLNNKDVDKIIICSQKRWFEHLQNIIDTYIFQNKDKIYITESGDDRNDSMIKGCHYIEKNFGINDDDIIITIDAVRMLVSDRIIQDNIKAAKKYSAVGTFFPVVDTVMESTDGKKITSMPIRKNMYQAQAPQTFNIKKLIKYYYMIDDDTKKDLTDVSKIFFLNNEDVHMVLGDFTNMKITYFNDFDIVESILNTKR